MTLRRQIGARIIDDRCDFTLWAPFAERVTLELEGKEAKKFPMKREAYGYWNIQLEGISPGVKYYYSIDKKERRPDPASLYQPDGVHGPSMVTDIGGFIWDDKEWNNIDQKDMIIYELHTGSFSESGTFEAIEEKLDYLIDLGINAVELMPVSQFPGERNWGYDGVYPFAVQNSYGGPGNLMHLVNACHKKGLAVILDVVYNHLGPEGNYLEYFGPYFTSKYNTPWGKAVNFDDHYCYGLRNYVIENALMWFRDFHIDALRLDAIHAIFDYNAVHILEELANETANYCAQSGKRHYLIAESDLNDTKIIKSKGNCGYGMDAQWNEDFHHALHALITGERSGYYKDFGRIEQLKKAFTNAFVYDGVFSEFRHKVFGNSTRDVPCSKFIAYSQNHDQTGNRKNGDRLISLAGYEFAKLAAGCVLFSPFIPMLFMGEEYGEQNPFLYFVSHNDPELNKKVREGRNREFKSFYADDKEPIPNPSDKKTFLHSRLSWSFKEEDRAKVMLDFYRQLIGIRKSYPAINSAGRFYLKTSSENKVLTILNEKDQEMIWLLLNFSQKSQTIDADFAEYIFFTRKIDSADEKWGGPGVKSQEKVKTGEQIHIQPASFILYTSSSSLSS